MKLRKRRRGRKVKGRVPPRVRRYAVIGDDGDPCPRCEMPTQIRQHIEITEKHLNQPYYYSRWFFCTNQRCRTTLVMPSRYIVWNEGHGPEAALVEQLSQPVGL